MYRAHPRSREENTDRGPAWPTRPGSSPLTRGKLTRSPRRTKPGGLIPAHAGKTRGGAVRARRGRAHPRSRGENSAPASAWLIAAGSSPLTRGKLRRDRCPVLRHGLIPAHAGKTTTSTRSPKTSRAHPRSRGENAELARALRNLAGSSPLTRGKRNQELIKATGAGLIPAHAGKTWRSWCQSCWWGAHPRSRGENARAGV